MARLFSLEMNRPRRAIIIGIPQIAVFQYPDFKAILYQDQKIPFRELSAVSPGGKGSPCLSRGNF